MEKSAHLNFQEKVGAVLEGPSSLSSGHLAVCKDCQVQLASLLLQLSLGMDVWKELDLQEPVEFLEAIIGKWEKN